MTPAAIAILIVAGWVLAGLVGLQLILALLRAFLPGAPVAEVRTVASALAAALRSGGDPARALAAAAPRLRWPFSWRARAAAERLADDPQADLVWTLAQHRLLPSALLASGEAAEHLGAAPLQRWAEGLARRPGWNEALLLPLAPYLGIALMAGGVITFVQIFIIPKFEQIARELCVRMDPRLGWLPEPGAWLWALVPILGLAGFLLARWHWRAMRAEAAAETILAGVESGAGEKEIGHAFADAWVQAAGETGDFPGLVAEAVGWRGIGGPVDLAAALAARQDLRRRRMVWTRLTLQVVSPLLLAVPVWVLAGGIFATLINFMYALAYGGPS